MVYFDFPFLYFLVRLYTVKFYRSPDDWWSGTHLGVAAGWLVRIGLVNLRIHNTTATSH